MAEAAPSNADLEVRRRKLLFRAWHRGMREVDLIMLVKHLLDRNSPADRFNMLVVTGREAWMGQRPLYPFARQPVGVGDLTSAVFVARTLLGDSVKDAFEHTVAAVNAVVRTTWDAGRYELEIVAAQDEIARPRDWFDAWVVESA